jgi:hypothetical protein
MFESFDVLVAEEEAPRGLELLLAAKHGPLGGLLILGFGGRLADELGNEVVLSATADLATITAALGSSRLGRVLEHDDSASTVVTISRVASVAARLSALVRENAVQSIEVNPLIVSTSRAVACDVKVRILDEASHQPAAPAKGS